MPAAALQAGRAGRDKVTHVDPKVRARAFRPPPSMLDYFTAEHGSRWASPTLPNTSYTLIQDAEGWNGVNKEVGMA